MKSITMSRDAFVSASSKAFPFIEKDVTLPIYSCYRLDFDGTNLYITASMGGNHQITTFCAAQGDKFTVCVSAYMLHKLALSLIESELTFQFPESKGQLKHLRITGRGHKHDLPIFDPVDFYILPEPEKRSRARIKGSVFTGMIGVAMSLIDSKRNEMHPQMAGINMTLHEALPGSFIMQGGTGHSFAVAEYPACGIDKWDAVTIDKAPVKDIAELVQGHEDVEMYHDNMRVVISTASARISTRLLEGKFPDMAKLLTSVKTTGRIRLNAGEIGMALRRLSYHKSETVKILVMNIPDHGNMVLSLDNNEQGSIGNEEVELSGNPEPVVMGFSHTLLSESLRSAHAVSLELSYSVHDKPMVITATESEDNRWNCSILIAPTRIK
jgi:DNA polymerase III sliding clamp (beta) subunit (PCNA family)